jgi:hypothetical protein
MCYQSSVKTAYGLNIAYAPIAIMKKKSRCGNSMRAICKDKIAQPHEHILCMRKVDGRWVEKCIHHECEYFEEIDNSAYLS